MFLGKKSENGINEGGVTIEFSNYQNFAHYVKIYEELSKLPNSSKSHLEEITEIAFFDSFEGLEYHVNSNSNPKEKSFKALRDRMEIHEFLHEVGSLEGSLTSEEYGGKFIAPRGRDYIRRLSGTSEIDQYSFIPFNYCAQVSTKEDGSLWINYGSGWRNLVFLRSDSEILKSDSSNGFIPIEDTPIPFHRISRKGLVEGVLEEDRPISMVLSYSKSNDAQIDLIKGIGEEDGFDRTFIQSISERIRCEQETSIITTAIPHTGPRIHVEGSEYTPVCTLFSYPIQETTPKTNYPNHPRTA